ncbi:hypothetical protein DFH08DRAFT_938791 [Mycena albidolilacea]|uniref:Zn(2)-C6 fungal-type domain-containing protein n=1 Tax=Mycena albidolilacea TaxID=1033008 RepID=A0AAD7EMG4_9AGAR|nr:hypothetical protein DFH08DRAFT_938791 [Mycena albidolilacea]
MTYSSSPSTSSSLFTKRRRAFVACKHCRIRKVKASILYTSTPPRTEWLLFYQCAGGSDIDYVPCTRCEQKGLKCEFNAGPNAWFDPSPFEPEVAQSHAYSHPGRTTQPIIPPSAGINVYLGSDQASSSLVCGSTPPQSSTAPVAPSSPPSVSTDPQDMYAFTQDGGKTQFMPHFNNGIDPDLGLLNPVMYNVDFRPPYASQTDSRGTQYSYPKVVPMLLRRELQHPLRTPTRLYYSKVFLFHSDFSDQPPISFTHSLELLLQEFAHHEHQQFPFGINLSGMTGVIWRESPFRPDHSIKARKRHLARGGLSTRRMHCIPFSNTCAGVPSLSGTARRGVRSRSRITHGSPTSVVVSSDDSRRRQSHAAAEPAWQVRLNSSLKKSSKYLRTTLHQKQNSRQYDAHSNHSTGRDSTLTAILGIGRVTGWKLVVSPFFSFFDEHAMDIVVWDQESHIVTVDNSVLLFAKNMSVAVSTAITTSAIDFQWSFKFRSRPEVIIHPHHSILRAYSRNPAERSSLANIVGLEKSRRACAGGSHISHVPCTRCEQKGLKCEFTAGPTARLEPSPFEGEIAHRDDYSDPGDNTPALILPSAGINTYLGPNSGQASSSLVGFSDTSSQSRTRPDAPLPPPSVSTYPQDMFAQPQEGSDTQLLLPLDNFVNSGQSLFNPVLCDHASAFASPVHAAAARASTPAEDSYAPVLSRNITFHSDLHVDPHQENRSRDVPIGPMRAYAALGSTSCTGFLGLSGTTRRITQVSMPTSAIRDFAPPDWQPPNAVATLHRMPDEPPGSIRWLTAKSLLSGVRQQLHAAVAHEPARQLILQTKNSYDCPCATLHQQQSSPEYESSTHLRHFVTPLRNGKVPRHFRMREELCLIAGITERDEQKIPLFCHHQPPRRSRRAPDPGTVVEPDLIAGRQCKPVVPCVAASHPTFGSQSTDLTRRAILKMTEI